jgi:hypothetical protein
LTGFEAITAHNGWAMAVTGIIIVITGLALLATIISQLHKVIALFERKHTTEPVSPAIDRPQSPAPTADLLTDLPAAARFFQILTAQLGESFELIRLFEVLKTEDVPHPHMSVKTLRENGYLVPVGQGRFTWK